MEILERKLK